MTYKKHTGIKAAREVNEILLLIGDFLERLSQTAGELTKLAAECGFPTTKNLSDLKRYAKEAEEGRFPEPQFRTVYKVMKVMGRGVHGAFFSQAFLEASFNHEPPPPLDKHLLFLVIYGVERVSSRLVRRIKKSPPFWRANVIARIYEHCLNNKIEPDETLIEKLMPLEKLE